MKCAGALLIFSSACVSSSSAADGVSFITVGDWGGAALEETSKPYAQNVKDVSAQMAATASEKSTKFIVNTGDNFYWCGIQNTSDFQVAADWVNSYPQASLQIPWYSILGNHEYAYNVSAQVDLANKYKNWIMDDRYYSRRVQLSGSNYLSMILIDTSPCIQDLRSDDDKYWDPCAPEYPTCSLSGGSDDFEGKCNMHNNVISQDCGKQFEWFKSALAKVPKDDWLIVVGHHPADEIDVQDFTTAMQEHGFDLYLNGHTHALLQYEVDGNPAYVTSGAGSLVMSADQLHETTYNKTHGLEVGLGKSNHAYKPVFTAKKSGFTSHTFSEDYSTLTTDFLDSKGNNIHSFKVTKGKSPTPTPPSPSPGPGPTPGPSPAGNCCFSHDTSCSKGQTCCSGSGKSYESEDTCKRYGSKHGCTWSGGTCVVGGGSVSGSITI